jgi:hypothetical protein
LSKVSYLEIQLFESNELFHRFFFLLMLLVFRLNCLTVKPHHFFMRLTDSKPDKFNFLAIQNHQYIFYRFQTALSSVLLQLQYGLLQ